MLKQIRWLAYVESDVRLGKLLVGFLPALVSCGCVFDFISVLAFLLTAVRLSRDACFTNSGFHLPFAASSHF